MQTLGVLRQLYLAKDEAFVAGLFHEFLDADPDPTIQGELIEALKSGGTRDEALGRIIHSSLFERLFTGTPPLVHSLQRVLAKEGYEFVRMLFIELTGREPSLRDLQSGLDSLTGGMTKLELLQNRLLLETTMLESSTPRQESAAVAPAWTALLDCDDGAFILGLYQELLDREPSWEELTFLSEELSSGRSRRDAFRAVLRGPEFAGLVQKTPPQTRIRFFHSIQRLDAAHFVTEMYLDCLGRRPDDEGLRYYERQLEEGTTRLEILRRVVLSPEARRLYNQGDIASGRTSPLEGRMAPGSKPEIAEELRRQARQIISENGLAETAAILVKSGGLGDFVQLTAVARALKRQDPGRPVIAAMVSAQRVPASLFDENPFIDLSFECGRMDTYLAVRSLFGLAENVFDLRYVSCAYGSWRNAPFFFRNKWYYDHFPKSGSRVEELGMHVCDLMLHSLGLERYGTCSDVVIAPDSMPEEIPGDYVVVCDHAGSARGALRQWLPGEWHELIQWLHSQRIIPVQLGSVKDLPLNPGVMDLRGKTTLRQAAGYLRHSKGYIGIDGGLYNLAEAVKTPSVVIFGPTSETCAAYPGTRAVTTRRCTPCWWTENAWERGICPRGRESCLNLPDWESVAREVYEMLSRNVPGAGKH